MCLFGDIVLLMLVDVIVLKSVLGVVYVVLERSVRVIIWFSENDFLGCIIGIIFDYFYVKDWEMV